MDASRYTALAERLVVVAEPRPGEGVVTIAGSGVGGSYPVEIAAREAAKSADGILAAAIAGLLAAERDGDPTRAACELDGKRVAAKVVGVAPGLRGFWHVTIADQPLVGRQEVAVARAWAARVRDELAAALRLEIEIEGEAAVMAERCGPPESLGAENARLRAQVRELEAQLAEERARAERRRTERDAAVLVRDDATKRVAELERRLVDVAGPETVDASRAAQGNRAREEA